MEVYKISSSNAEINAVLQPLGELFFSPKEVAEKVIAFFDLMAAEGVDFDWHREIITVLNEEEAVDQLKTILLKK